MAEPFSHVSQKTNDAMLKLSLAGHKKAEAADKKKSMAGKMSRKDKVGTRKADIVGGRQGNWMKVMKGDR